MQTFTEFLLEMDIPSAPSSGLDSGTWADQYKRGNTERMVNEGAELVLDRIQEVIEPAKEKAYGRLIEQFDQVESYEQGVKFAHFLIQTEVEQAMSRR